MSSTDKTESLKTKTAKGFLWGGLSNGLQQIFGLVFGIILGRILMPEDMGIVGILMIFSTIASALTESGFVSALSIRKEVSHKDYNAVFWFCIMAGAVLYSFLFMMAPALSSFFEIPELKTLSRVSFLNFFISSFGVAHSAYLTRHLQIRERAISITSAVVIGGIFGISAAWMGLGYWALVIQNLSYCIIVNAGFSYFSAFRPTFSFHFSPLRPLFAYSSKLVITNVFINLNNNFLTTSLGKFYTPVASGNTSPTAIAGQFNQANKWNLMGQTMILSISNSLIQPLMAEVSIGDRDRKTRIFRKLVTFISFITFPMMFGLALVSHDFIVATVGEKWLESAEYLRIIAFGGAFAVISNAFSNYTLSRGKSSIYMWNIISFGLLQILLFIYLRHFGLSVLLLSYSALNMLWLNTWFFICRDSLRYNYKYLFRDVYLYAATALVAYITTSLWIDSIHNLYIRLVVSIAAMGTIYLTICYFHSREIFMEIKQFFIKKI